MSILDRILRIGEGRTLRRLEKLAGEVLAKEDEYKALTDQELQGKTAEFKALLEDGATLDELLVDAFATVREAADRVLKLRPYKVQIMGGIALHEGNIAEMKTGEGKTLVATMPSYLRALAGKGVHVITVNDYLASYQSELMGRVYRFLGLTVGCIVANQSPDERRKQYNADITYGTNNEFGFDYLRDNMAQSVESLVQRDHYFVIVDEVDSILIDEARTPLIISGPAEGEADQWYSKFSQMVRLLERGRDYEVDEKKRTVGVTEAGIEAIEDMLGIDNLYEAAHTPLIGFLNNAIKAKELFKRDRDYIVSGGEVIIVDEHTGRTMEGRRYNEGIHQAIEAKEGVEVKAENQTLATITLQNYFRLYEVLAGMTGTAETEAAEFANTYKIGVVPIPTNKPMIRQDKADLVYPTRAGKLRAIVKDIAERHEKGQPVLVGTTDVAKSEELSALLKEVGVPHTVLNAKQHKREAEIVFDAGRKGAVTVATNMAGRGTDIMLGGNPERIAEQEVRAAGFDPEEDLDAYRKAYEEALPKAEAAVKAEHDEVKELGGLYVLGTERHDSRRIDNQLRGRSGRQGDPGESRFYLSMQDPLMLKFATGLAQRIMASDSYPEDLPLEGRLVSRTIESAQSQVEAQHAEIRKNVLKYDDVMTGQRELIYDQRRQVLNDKVDMGEQVPGFIEQVIRESVAAVTAEGSPEDWELEKLWTELRSIYPISLKIEDLEEEVGGRVALSSDDVTEALLDDITDAYATAVEEVDNNPVAISQLGDAPMNELERRVLLGTVDRLWREHLYEMEYLKEGIGLRAMGQRDPLVEYSSEGAQMFTEMMGRIRQDTVSSVFGFAHQFKAVREQLEAQQADNSGNVMGTVGASEEPTNIAYSGPSDSPSSEEEEGASAGQAEGKPMNRSERRAAKKKNRS